MGLFKRNDKIERGLSKIEGIMSATLAEWLGSCNAAAKTMIMEEIAALDETTSDGVELGAYIRGLIEMAYKLQALDNNERNTLTDRVDSVIEYRKTLGSPQYKRKGIYEYRGYNIIKIINDGDGAANWAIAKVDSGKYIKSGLTFKEAQKEIERLTK